MLKGGIRIAAVAALLVAAPAIAGPSMAMKWMALNDDQDTCVKQASAAMRQSGFNTRFEVLNNRSIYGERADYTAAIRCVAEKGIAFLAVAGPNADQANKYVDAIAEKF